ncbi:hypothetical protein KIF24_13200 [Micromonospora sp. Llam7]|uniref:hypothetical protein n=1 Tax=Micromonospora tarapacensis TaxID=2835305 RepID=UPI001C82CDFB|nr:hypothetical protein [Micromonospora tarapacensis]MBX7266886.1 hypothetical protein [Micromonospora tarapacensis]
MRPPGTLAYPLPAGAVLDRLALLRVKQDLLTHPPHRRIAAAEHALVLRAWTGSGLPAPRELPAYASMSVVHRMLWNLENVVRAAERQGDLGPGFVAVTARIHRLNAVRAAHRRAADADTAGTGVDLVEVPQCLDAYADRIAIAEVRRHRRPDTNQVGHLILRDSWLSRGLPDLFDGDLFRRLCHTNDRLWSAKEELETTLPHAPVAACRRVYLVNDARVRAKRRVAEALRCALRDVKEYVRYPPPAGWDDQSLTWSLPAPTPEGRR